MPTATMQIRNHRPSDVVAAVFFPASLLLYLHLMLLSSPTPSSNQEPIVRITKVEAPLNLTGRGRQDLLLVTPILRCASTSVINLLNLMATRNGFKMAPVIRKKAELVHVPNVKMQQAILNTISNYTGPIAVLQPVAFINFTQFGKAPPIRVSLVRDPVERAVSWYYHARAPYHLVERHAAFPETRLPTRMFLKKDLESCLKSRGDPECQWVPGKEVLGHTTEFFCGHHHYCPMFGDTQALQMAKTVVEREWSVVGVLEEWNKTMTVLHHYIPSFFSGASKVYYEHLHNDKVKTNTNFYKPYVDPKAKEFMKKSFQVEYEFYEFVKQRLDQQYRALVGDSYLK